MFLTWWGSSHHCRCHTWLVPVRCTIYSSPHTLNTRTEPNQFDSNSIHSGLQTAATTLFWHSSIAL